MQKISPEHFAANLASTSKDNNHACDRTDRYTYDAHGTLLKQEGTFDNSFVRLTDQEREIFMAIGLYGCWQNGW